MLMFGKKKRDLNAVKRRDRIKKIYLIIFIVLFFICAYLCCVVATYRNLYNEANFISGIYYGVQKIPEIIFSFNFSGDYTKGTLLGFGLIWLIICLLLWTEENKAFHDMSGIESGSAQWNNNIKAFKKEYGDSDPFNTTILSRDVALSMDDHKTKRNSNILTVGGAGTGKSRYHIKPNLLQANANYVVNDPSGELIESTAHVLMNEGYEIKILNLIEANKSSCYNPFHYLRNEMTVMSMIHCLIENTTPPNEHSGDPFWEKAEMNLLQALCFYLWQHRPVEDQNFETVMKLLRMAEVQENNANFQSDLDRIFLKPKNRPVGSDKVREANYDEERSLSPAFEEWQRETLFTENGKLVKNTRLLSLEEMDPYGKDIAVNMYKTFQITAGKTAKSILTSVMSRLQAFNIPEICALTAEDNMHLEELSGTVEGHEKQALFLVLPQADDTYAFLVSMLYTQLFETLEFIGTTKCQNARLPRNVKCLLDEFSNTCRIPQFDKTISVIRKYGISCDVVLQSLSQIKSQYEKEWETIVGNCDTKLFLGSSENTTTEYFSKLLGKQTITTKDRSTSNDAKGGHGSSSFKNTARELMFPDEIGNMPNEDCLVIIRGVDPFYSKKYDYLEHPRYSMSGDANLDYKYYMPVTNNGTRESEAAIRAQQIRAMKYNEIKPMDHPEELAEDTQDEEKWEDIFKRFQCIMVDEDAAERDAETIDSQKKQDKKPDEIKVAITLEDNQKEIIKPISECKAPAAPYNPFTLSDFDTEVALVQKVVEENAAKKAEGEEKNSSHRKPIASWNASIVRNTGYYANDDEES